MRKQQNKLIKLSELYPKQNSYSFPLLDICPLLTYTMSMTDINKFIPLTPAVFYILLSLAKGEKHGYEIMKQVKQDTSGKVTMGNGTMYGSLKRMLIDKLIEDAGDKVDPNTTRRKYYKLTGLGRKALNAEMKRYVETATLIEQRKLIPALSINLAI